MEKNDLEKFCRTYAFVEIKDMPYDGELVKLKTAVYSTYQKGVESYNKNLAEIQKILKTLEDISSENNSFLGIFKFGKTSELENTEKMGLKLIEAKDKLKSLQGIVNQSYNQIAGSIYEISRGTKLVDNFLAGYAEKEKKIEEEIKNLNEIHGNPEKLEEFVSDLINEKQKRERKELSSEEKKALKKYLVEKGDERIKKLADEYLKIENDFPIARSLNSYESLIDNYQGLADSFNSVRERLNKDIDKISEVMKVYEIVTKMQINFLKEINIPDKYIDAINNLITGLERINDNFSGKILESVFTNGKAGRISDINLGGVIPDLIKHIKEKEAGDAVGEGEKDGTK